MSKVENKLPFQTKERIFILLLLRQLHNIAIETPSKQRLYFYSGTNKFLSVVVYATIGYDKKTKTPY